MPLSYGPVTGHTYNVAYECGDLDIGTGSGRFVYLGVADEENHEFAADWGKHAFKPLPGGPVIYLLPDEITGLA